MRVPVYVPGKPAATDAAVTAYKLSSNENPYPPLPGVLEATAEAVGRMNRYPDMANAAMTSALGDRLEVEANRLAFGTGSVAVLYHLLQATCEAGDEVVYAWRSFEAYPIAVLITGATPVPVPLGPGAVHDLAAMRAAITPATRAVLLCTPSNPTGPALPHAEVVAFVDGVPEQVMVVLDEAYVEFVTGEDRLRGLEVLAGRPNVVVLRTFSKAYGLAGFRVGYCVAAPGWRRRSGRCRCPSGCRYRRRPRYWPPWPPSRSCWIGWLSWSAPGTSWPAGCGSWDSPCPKRRATSSGCRPGRGPRRTEAFAEAGLTVRAFAAGEDQDGVRITVGEPEANERVLEVAATLPR